MKNFAKFLIDKKVIDQDQFIEACSSQEEKACGLIKVLREHEMLDKSKMTELILESIESGEHIYNLLHSHDASIAQEVIDELQKRTPSFTSLLIEHSFVEQQELKKLYEEYKNFSTESEPVGNSSSEEGLSAAALESLRELGMDTTELETSSTPVASPSGSVEIKNDEFELEDHDMEYLNFFDQSRKDDLLTLVESVEKKLSQGGDFQNLLNSLFKDFHLLKGAARLDDLKLSEKLIDQSEQLVCLVIESHAQGPGIFSDYKTTLIDAVSTIWDIRQTILEKGEETFFWKNENNKGRYMQLMKNLKYHPVAA